ncbi:MAG: hypothetical protein HOH48_04180 [Candidatus Puniceispirillum sp.]|jgi:hypothetical protein|uniref:hypothetical protein n=1 Tax=Candidatus Puniceispirillum sp. TaxID=2026719 RepID=UPI001ED2869D|nr:hypothetical protein [Candidatus Puniceispirillum sp.]MBT6416413.1 hypothetical protein [Candidatus Puniceispirillum sp.]
MQIKSVKYASKLGIILIFALAGITKASATTLEFKNAKDFWAKAGKEELLKDLKDPMSAQISKLCFVNGLKDGYIVTGEINAKNSFGGYTGFKEFMVVYASLTSWQPFAMIRNEPIFFSLFDLSKPACR